MDNRAGSRNVEGAGSGDVGGRVVEYFWLALPSIISAAVLFLAGALYRKSTSVISSWRAEHSTLMESQRNQIKNSIVRICEEAINHGWITAMQLETLCRLYESYVKLGGNSYIKALVEDVKRLPIKGKIPIIEEGTSHD